MDKQMTQIQIRMTTGETVTSFYDELNPTTIEYICNDIIKYGCRRKNSNEDVAVFYSPYNIVTVSYKIITKEDNDG